MKYIITFLVICMTCICNAFHPVHRAARTTHHRATYYPTVHHHNRHTTQTTPEPSSLTLMLVGLSFLSLKRKNV